MDEFLLEGQVLADPPEPQTPEHDYAGYGEENKADFLFQFTNHAVPFSGREG